MQHPRGVTGLEPGVSVWRKADIGASSRRSRARRRRGRAGPAVVVVVVVVVRRASQSSPFRIRPPSLPFADAVAVVIADRLPKDEHRAMAALLEEAGRLSARAQALPAPITSLVRAGPRVPLHLSSSVRRPPRLVSTFDLVPVPVPVPAVSPSPTARLPHLPVVIASSSSSQERLHADQRLYIASHDASDPSRGPSVVLGFLKVGEKRLFVSDPRGNTVEIEPCCVLDFYVHESCQRGGIGSELFARFLEEEDHRPARLAYDRPSHKLKSFLRCVLSHTGPHTTAFAW